jgi:hypothetical protein
MSIFVDLMFFWGCVAGQLPWLAFMFWGYRRYKRDRRAAAQAEGKTMEGDQSAG